MDKKSCYHCGDLVLSNQYVVAEKSFCCNGCLNVFQLLENVQMKDFYKLEKQAGVKPLNVWEGKYDFLNVEEIKLRFIDFKTENQSKTTLFLPQIHCSSCIYLLEHAYKLQKGINKIEVDFAKKEAVIYFDESQLSFAQLALFLDTIGYAPNFGERKNVEKQINKKFLLKLGIAGFAFGSVMLWSFPEYLGLGNHHAFFRNFTSWLSFIVSIPVLLFSASEYWISAFKAVRNKNLNLDVPITIGIIALYFQSSYVIFTGNGPGYMDSFTSFIFLLLIGKWFQNKTYRSLSFDRDYTSYFPVAVTKINPLDEQFIEIEKVKIGDTIQIRNQEIIPCDATLLSNDVAIDYSFVTGESIPIQKKKGDFIYAGGKLLGPKALFKVEKESKRSHLTQLWNHSSENKDKYRKSYQDKVSYYFLIIIFIISTLTALAWIFIDAEKILGIVVSILIVACPCALALSAPFTYGNVLRVLGLKGLYLKNAKVIERLNETTDIVFDKTGTLTKNVHQNFTYQGEVLNKEQQDILFTLCSSSTHPLSKIIAQQFQNKVENKNLIIEEFQELSGLGIQARVDGKLVKIGSAVFQGLGAEQTINNTQVLYSIDHQLIGSFIFESTFRDGLKEMVNSLKNYHIHVLSGDNNNDESFLKEIMPPNTQIHFNQSPHHKKEYIETLQKNGHQVLMIGDGLNDSGALASANVGIAVSEDVFRFTPSSDAIIEAENISIIPRLLHITKFSKKVLQTCLAFSISYNILGLSYAISGNMSPLVAAILMPISSITVVLISTLMIRAKSR